MLLNSHRLGQTCHQWLSVWNPLDWVEFQRRQMQRFLCFTDWNASSNRILWRGLQYVSAAMSVDQAVESPLSRAMPFYKHSIAHSLPSTVSRAFRIVADNNSRRRLRISSSFVTTIRAFPSWSGFCSVENAWRVPQP